MNWKRIARLLSLLAILAIGLMACSISGVPFISKVEPTATQRATRAARATFTPRPKVTATLVPTDVPPTDVPATAVPVTVAPPTATRKPIVQATAKPKPTNAPPTAIPSPQPTTNPFTYAFYPWRCDTTDPAICNAQNGVGCSHSGQHSIKVQVYANHKDAGSALAGIKVRFSGTPGGPLIDPDEVTQYDGTAVKTLSNVSDAPEKNTGTFFAWLVNAAGNPISPFSPPIPINAKNENDAQTCWVGQVVFAGGN